MRQLLLPLLLSLLQLLSILFILVATFFVLLVLPFFLYLYHLGIFDIVVFAAFLIPVEQKKANKIPPERTYKKCEEVATQKVILTHTLESIEQQAGHTHSHTLVQRDFLLVCVCNLE